VVASSREAPPGCAALLIDRAVLRQTGAVALRRDGNGFSLTAARPQGHDRPWARAPNATNTAQPAAGSVARRPPAVDATPRLQDLQPGD
jgi:competence protein ComEC